METALLIILTYMATGSHHHRHDHHGENRAQYSTHHKPTASKHTGLITVTHTWIVTELANTLFWSDYTSHARATRHDHGRDCIRLSYMGLHRQIPNLLLQCTVAATAVYARWCMCLQMLCMNAAHPTEHNTVRLELYFLPLCMDSMMDMRTIV